MKKLKLIFFFLICLSETYAQSQQQADFNLTYWNYRDRFKKFFVEIGKNNGESLPMTRNMSSAALANGGWAWYVKNFTPCSVPGSSGVDYGAKDGGGDCMGTQMWQYLPTLATEYRLLRDQGKDYMPTLTELYYALEAIKRADQNAERYYGATDPDENGFFLRDDINITLNNAVATDISADWRSFYTKSQDPQDLVSVVHSSTHPDWDCDATTPDLTGTGAEMSQDQAIGILFGLSFIRKYCSDAPTIQPDPGVTPLPAMNVYDEAAAIYIRIVGYISSNQTQHVPYTYFNGTWVQFGWWSVSHQWKKLASHYVTGTADVVNSYQIVNPATQKLVQAGSNSIGFSYGLYKACEKWTGNQVNDIVDMTVLIPFTPIGNNPLMFSYNTSIYDINTLFYQPYQNWLEIAPWTGQSPPKVESSSKFAKFILTYDPFAFQYRIQNFELDLESSINTISGIRSHSDIVNINGPNKTDNIIYDLAYSALWDQAPQLSQSYFEDSLSFAPCDGPNGEDTHWFNENVWAHPNPTTAIGAQYGGLDYCLLYNLYRLEYRNNPTTMPDYGDNACPCILNPALDYCKGLFDNNSTINQTLNIYRRFPDYLALQTPSSVSGQATDGSIHINEYINSDLTVAVYNSTFAEAEAGDPYAFIKTLNIYTDVYECCNPLSNGNPFFSTFTIGKNGTVNVGDGTTPSSLTVRGVNVLNVGEPTASVGDAVATLAIHPNTVVEIQKGATLNLNANGKIVLDDNCTLIIDDGAQFNYYNGAHIVLNGANSVLKIYGNLYIGTNATFTYSGDYPGYIYWNCTHNGTNTSPTFTCGDNANVILNNGATNYNKTALQVDGGWLYVPNNLSEFVIFYSTIDAFENSGIDINSPLSIHTTHLTSSHGASTDFIHNGIRIYGQYDQSTLTSTVSINNVTIDKGWFGLTCSAIPNIPNAPAPPPTPLSSLTIYNCNYSLVTNNGGINLTTANLHNNTYGWVANGMYIPSIVSDLTSTYNSNNGVDYHGANTAQLILTNPTLTYNGENGLNINGPFECDITCGTASNNTGAGISAGAGVILDMSAVNPSGYGNVAIHDNGRGGIAFDEAADLRLNNGQNDIYNNVSGTNDISGILQNATLCETGSMNANANEWNAGGAAPSSGEPGDDVNIAALCDLGGGYMIEYPITINDIAPLNSFTVCPGSTFGIPPPTCSDCRNIYWIGTDVTETVSAQILDAKAEIGTSGTANNLDAFQRLYFLLTLSSPAWNADEQIYISAAYDIINQAYADGILTNQIPSPGQYVGELSGTDFAGYVQEINTNRLTDAVMSTSSTINTVNSTMANVSILSMAGQFSEANAALSTLDTFTNVSIQDINNHWNCVTTVNQMIKDSVIQPGDFMSYFQSCQLSFRKEGGNSLNPNSNKNAKEFAVSLYPNPANNYLVVQALNVVGTDVMINIYDLKGIKISSVHYASKGNGFLQRLGTIDLAQGIYLLEISDGTNTKVSKFTVVR